MCCLVLLCGCVQPPGDLAAELLPLTIDATKPGPPIDEKVFGVFIEHQGRCIYGGVWAELLEDRKFYYPVKGSFTQYAYRSPWSMSGDGVEISMETTNPYVGQHSVKVLPSQGGRGGIQQSKLALQKDRRYAGYVVLQADPGVAVTVALSWGDAPGQRVELLLSGLTSSYRKATFELTATEDATDGRLELLGQGGVFRVGAASLMPADNVKGLRADTLKLLQEVRPPVIRWPGGAFADYYDWRDGVGDRDRRPPRLIWSYDQPALESHDFGLQEFMQLCEILKAQPDLAIKAMTAADAAPAAEAVEYCNGGSETKLGALRGKHGHPQPFGVSWWGVGNESYSYMQADSFTGLHQQLVKAMRAVDPSIKIVAVGGVGVPGISGVGDWTRSMLTRCADQLDMISEHVYGAGDADLWKHANAIRAGILDVVSRHRLLRQGTSDLKPGIGIAFDEWNYDWLGRQEFYGEAGVRYEQRHALGTAAALFALFDSSDLVSMANAHAVNAHGFIKTSATAAAFETTGLVFKLFRNHFGKHPLPLVGSPEKQLDPVGLTAALTADRTALTIGAVNPSTRRYTLTPVIKGATLAAQGQRWTIASTDPLAYNEPGQPPAVQIEEQALAATHTLELPPLSICLYRVGLSWASP